MATYMMNFGAQQGFIDGANAVHSAISESYNNAMQTVNRMMAEQDGATAEAATQIHNELTQRHEAFTTAHANAITTSSNILENTQSTERKLSSMWGR